MDLLDPSTLPPGFGFHPTDVELISHYLKRKVLGIKNEMEVIPVVDIYKYEPWDLPAKSRIPSREGKWHFFNTRDRKYPNGFRSNRATEAGYWKSTGKDRVIRVQKRAIGTKKTLVFHQGRPPRGKRTEWIMHEYYLDDNEYKNAVHAKNIYVLCRVTKRTGLVPECENVSDPVDKEDSPVSLDEICSEPAEDLIPGENFVEPLTISKAEFEAWLTELYDPDFSAVAASTNLAKQEVDSGFLAPKAEPGVLSPAAADSGNHLSTGVLDHSNFDNFDWPQVIFEDETNPLHHQFNIDPQEIFVDHNIMEYFDAASFLESCQTGPGAVQNEMNSGFNSDEFGSLDGISESGIHIRQRRRDTFVEPNEHRIKLQIHKMEAHNNRPTNETHVFVSDDHHLEEIEPEEDTTSIDSKSTGMPYTKQPATPERTEQKAYRRTTPQASQDCYEQSYTSEYGHPHDFPPYYQYEYSHRSANKADKPHFTRDSGFRYDIRRLAREARKEARSIFHKYKLVARNCMLIGTCLVGGTAWATFMQEAF